MILRLSAGIAMEWDVGRMKYLMTTLKWWGRLFGGIYMIILDCTLWRACKPKAILTFLNGNIDCCDGSNIFLKATQFRFLIVANHLIHKKIVWSLMRL